MTFLSNGGIELILGLVMFTWIIVKDRRERKKEQTHVTVIK